MSARRVSRAPKSEYLAGSSRPLFLQAVEDLAPEVLIALRDGPYKLAREGSRCMRDSAALRSSLQAWAERYDLIDNWILDWAMQTLFWWSLCELTDPPRWCVHWYKMIDPRLPIDDNFFVKEFPAFEIAQEPWQTKLQSGERYRAAVLRQFDIISQNQRQELIAALDAYLKAFPHAMRAQCIDDGGVHKTDHYYWLAGYQVKLWSIKHISQALQVQRRTRIRAGTILKAGHPAMKWKREKKNVDERTIRLAIQRLAKEIQLRRREAQPDFTIEPEQIRQELAKAMAKMETRPPITSYHRWTVPQTTFLSF